jgi:hypothetical protein
VSERHPAIHRRKFSKKAYQQDPTSVPPANFQMKQAVILQIADRRLRSSDYQNWTGQVGAAD